MGSSEIIQRRGQASQGGGRNAPEWVAGINRNARPEWIGIGGRNRPESVAEMHRNTQEGSKKGTPQQKSRLNCAKIVLKLPEKDRNR